MDVKEAVETAKTYVTDLFGSEGVMNVGLEEVEFDDSLESWKVTVGFSRPWDHKNAMTAALGDSRPARSYKIVRISDGDGSVMSITARRVSASE